MITLQDLGTDPVRMLGLREGPLVMVDCGVMPYQDALELQARINREVGSEKIPSACLMVEHPPVITLGIRKDRNILSCSAHSLSASGIEMVPVRRGGGGTAHNPGQLVMYPIIHLGKLGFRVAPFVHYLEQVGMDVLLHFGVSAQRKNRYPGLWVGEKKIASVGVQIIKGVSMHGIAINLFNNLDIFNYIIPCGIQDVEMTSAYRETGSIPSMAEAKIVSSKSSLARLIDKTSDSKEPV